MSKSNPPREGKIDIATAPQCLRKMKCGGFVSDEWIDCNMDLVCEIRSHGQLEPLVGFPV